jgi:hypothetical protein
MKRRHLALLAAIVGVTLAGCGGGDDSGSDTAASRGASGQQGTTAPQIGASGATGAGAPPKQNGKVKPRSPKRSGGERGGTGPAAPAKPASPKPTPPKPTPATPTTPSSSLTPKQIKVLKGGMYKQARFLCKASTLQGLAQQYGIKSGNVDEVAKAYAAPYPVGLRKPVAAGCKAGLLESK